jgi:hypothetical protein
MIILIILGVGGVLCLVCCGGFIWFGYAAMNMGMEMFADSIREQYGDHAAVREHIGELESVESDLLNAAAYQGQMASGELPFKVRGPKGEGTIIVREGAPRAKGQPGVAGGRLLLPDGEVIELDK